MLQFEHAIFQNSAKKHEKASYRSSYAKILGVIFATNKHFLGVFLIKKNSKNLVRNQRHSETFAVTLLATQELMGRVE
jgi:hypothetical protein